MACLMYFAVGDEVYCDKYAILGGKWEHDSSDEFDSSLPLFKLEEEE